MKKENIQFNELVRRYVEGVSYRGDSLRKIGVEKEILVIKKDGHMAQAADDFWPYYESKGYESHADNFYTEQITGFNAEFGHITTDAGLGVLEIILDPLDSVQEAEQKMSQGLGSIMEANAEVGHYISGMGMQPLDTASAATWNRKQRYEVVTGYFKELVYSSSLSASDQVHVDVSVDEMVSVANVMNAIAGFMMVLFDNSPMMHGAPAKTRCYREVFWDNLGTDRTGVPEKPFTSLEEYLFHVWNLQCVVLKDDNMYYSPKKTFAECVEEWVKDGTATSDKIYNNFKIHEGAVWYCARPRFLGTIEMRPTCLQPWDAMMTVPAFSVGLVENWKELEAFTKQFDWEFMRQLRLAASKQGFNLKIDGKSVSLFLKELLEISKAGLKSRGRGEEAYLETLYRRVEEEKSPADIALEIYEREGLSAMLKHTNLKKEHLTL